MCVVNNEAEADDEEEAVDMENKLNKPLIVFKSLLTGHQIDLDGRVYQLITENGQKRLCIVTSRWTQGQKPEPYYLRMEFPLDDFVNMCTKMSTNEIIVKCSDAALNAARREHGLT
jgi:hypothetical protein